ncbi:MAG: SUMF1/EgtB/PvdO family nonheme iron enzyme [Deltaproteobacteria bacterium]|nr:SUMF1/EgtB/PvdO family nonheme iron enzyme [Deltaproteobacteria bacterium]
MMEGYVNSLGMAFIRIEPGMFVMGDSPDSGFGFDDMLAHKVTISKPYFMQCTHVTVGHWQRFADETGYRTEVERNISIPWIFKKRDSWSFHWIRPRRHWQQSSEYWWEKPNLAQGMNHPVTCVTWADALAFADWLTQKEGRTYRLPTEAEWEYACRANTQTNYCFGDRLPVTHAKYFSNLTYVSNWIPFAAELLHINQTVAVKSYPPNAWGLYDMHGNAWEWCLDQCDQIVRDDESRTVLSDTYKDNVVDPLNSFGDHRILRGGSWAYPSLFSRSAHRRAEVANYSASGIGFRIILEN